MLTATDFLARYGDQTFRHSEELLAGIRSGDCELFDASGESQFVSTRELLDVYRQSADRLRGSTEARVFLVADKAGLLADVEALIVELESRLEDHAEELCGHWGFTLAPRYIFYVSDAPHSGRILGCQRIVPPDDRFAKRQASLATSTVSTRGGLAINLIPRGMNRRR